MLLADNQTEPLFITCYDQLIAVKLLIVVKLLICMIAGLCLTSCLC